MPRVGEPVAQPGAVAQDGWVQSDGTRDVGVGPGAGAGGIVRRGRGTAIREPLTRCR